MSGPSLAGVLVVIAIVIFVASRSGSGQAKARKGPLDELVQAVHADKQVAHRLVAAEQADDPSLSIDQAAALALKRLLADRRR